MKYILILYLLFAISCTDVAKNEKTKIAVNNSANITEYVVNKSQSTINWTGYKVQKSQYLNHFGTIQIKEGKIDLQNNLIKKARFTADLTSIKNIDETNPDKNKKLIQQLQSKEFLDVFSYPEAFLNITSAKKIQGKSDYNTELEGFLKIKNITQNISFKANVKIENNTLFLYTEKFPISRKKFRIAYNEISGLFITDDFDLQIGITAILK